VIAAIYLMSSRELIPQARHGSKNTPVNLSVSSKPNVRSGRHMAGFVILNITGIVVTECRLTPLPKTLCEMITRSP